MRCILLPTIYLLCALPLPFIPTDYPTYTHYTRDALYTHTLVLGLYRCTPPLLPAATTITYVPFTLPATFLLGGYRLLFTVLLFSTFWFCLWHWLGHRHFRLVWLMTTFTVGLIPLYYTGATPCCARFLCHRWRTGLPLYAYAVNLPAAPLYVVLWLPLGALQFYPNCPHSVRVRVH